jgi:hypothetical protein
MLIALSNMGLIAEVYLAGPDSVLSIDQSVQPVQFDGSAEDITVHNASIVAMDSMTFYIRYESMYGESFELHRRPRATNTGSEADLPTTTN